MQFINVFFKGNLILDLPRDGYLSHTLVNNDRFNEVHTVTIESGSILKEICGVDKLPVNSLHHQGVGNLSDKMKVSAKSEDGVIEAIEYKNLEERFILAMQWHPEMMAIKDERHQEIFNYFIGMSKKS